MSAQDAGSLISASDLVTVSDYFSFVGADSQGHVAFAIDNNRGRDGRAYQAEHFYAVLHDEHHGWMNVSGIGRYENTNHELLTIPDSSFFQFVGQPATGLTITSSANQLTLRLDAIPERLVLSDDETIFALGSAAAQLTWKERVIPGRVIYEYLVKKHFNLMTRRSLKELGEFQGLYLLAGTASDLYVGVPRLSTVAAIGTSLFLETSGFGTGVYRHLRLRLVDVKTAKTIILITLPLGALGAIAARHVPVQALRLGYGAAMLGLAWLLLWDQSEQKPVGDHVDSASLPGTWCLGRARSHHRRVHWYPLTGQDQ